MPDLAAILDEIERQQAAVASSDLFVDRFDEWRALERLYILHGPLLLRLAREGAEMRRHGEAVVGRIVTLGIVTEGDFARFRGAHAAWDAAASGAGEKETKPDRGGAMSRSARLYAVALPVECPHCGALPHFRCFVRSTGVGEIASRPHQARLDAARTPKERRP
ncbi:MAG: hypothetical protein LC136_04735 [Burkholderiales bacterium]|nr:hypothetical protein [Burkholderiales bacterium]